MIILFSSKSDLFSLISIIYVKLDNQGRVHPQVAKPFDVLKAKVLVKRCISKHKNHGYWIVN